MTPAAARAMTPEETTLMVEGWNAERAAESGEVRAPTVEEYEALVARYG